MHASVRQGFHTSCSSVHIDKVLLSLIACILHEHWVHACDVSTEVICAMQTLVAPQMADGWVGGAVEGLNSRRRHCTSYQFSPWPPKIIVQHE